MIEIPINYLAVAGAAAASIVLGFLWYGPLFGKPWMAMMGFTKESMETSKQKGMGKTYALMVVGSLVMSFVLAHAIVFASEYLETYGVAAGVMGGFWNWLGFVAPVTLGSVLWEGKSWKLWILNNAYYLVSFLIMGVILSVWQ